MNKAVLGSSNDYENAARQMRSWQSRGYLCHIESRVTARLGQIIYEIVKDSEVSQKSQ